MKCNLIVAINELVVREYTMIEEEGLLSLMSNRPGLSFSYEDETGQPGKRTLVIGGTTLKELLSFLSFIELPVRIIAE